jgi:acyl dehydratase
MLAYNRANDPWPMHVDAEAAAQTPFGGLIASGGYTISIMYRLGTQIWARPHRLTELQVPFEATQERPCPIRAASARDSHGKASIE